MRNTLEGLPQPIKRYDPVLAPPSVRSGHRMETAEEARAQDIANSARIIKACAGSPTAYWVSDATRLAEKLDYGGGDAPESLASMLWMHEFRRCVAAAVWQLVDDGPLPHSATAIPRRLRITPEELVSFDPRREGERLRADLYRAGAAEADGHLIAYLDGEYDPISEMLQLHWHLLVWGEMLGVLAKLKKQRAYKPGVRGNEPPVRRRIRIDRKPVSNLPYPPLYLWRGWWPARPRFGPKSERYGRLMGRRRGRIPEPVHTQVLLWLDRWRPSDLTLMIRVQVGSDGLRFTNNTAI